MSLPAQTWKLTSRGKVEVGNAQVVGTSKIEEVGNAQVVGIGKIEEETLSIQERTGIDMKEAGEEIEAQMTEEKATDTETPEITQIGEVMIDREMSKSDVTVQKGTAMRTEKGGHTTRKGKTDCRITTARGKLLD